MSVRRWIALTVCAAWCILSAGCASRGITHPPVSRSPARVASSIDSDETAVRAVLNDVEQAMEQQDVYRVLAHVSASYRDKTGRGYTDIRKFLQHVFENYGAIEIARSGSKVVVDGARAAVTETFVTFARGEPGTNVNPLTLRGQVSVYLEKIAGKWLIVEWGEKS